MSVKSFIGIQSLLIFALLMLSCKTRKASQHTLERAVKWMWAQQSEDGGWHSETHTVLRDGKVLTPYILYYLLHVPEEVYQLNNARLEKGLHFLTAQLDSVFNQDSTALIDYPNYSAAYALRTLHCMDTDTALQRKIATY